MLFVVLHEDNAGMKPVDIAKLMDPAAFPHAVDELGLVETHISWVILTGNFAYKIKKPVDLGFVDFTRLERRKYFCEEELRLNRRMAPGLYLEVVPIARTAEGFRIGGEPAMEYAVRMRQFPAEARLDRQVESGRLSGGDIPAMAKAIADFHLSLIPQLSEDPAAEFSQIRKFALDNFAQIRTTLAGDEFHALLLRLESWTREQLDLLGPEFRKRTQAGFVREGHGDLHLANMIKLNGRIVLFDCLEFDPAMRRLDLMNDIAFLVMDLMAHRREDLALILLNAYLEQTGDYPGLSVLRFYMVYRCLVRAKVAALQPRGKTYNAVVHADSKIRRYLKLAQSLIAHSLATRLILMHGFSGAGKSFLSERLIGPLGAIRVRSDLERKRLHGFARGQSSDSGIESGLYDAAATEKTYGHLEQYCRTGLRAGFNMIADASFLRQRERQRFSDLAAEIKVGYFILDCTSPVDILRKRIQERASDPEQVSEADLSVLDHQLMNHDAFTEWEKRHVICVPLDEGYDISGLLTQLERPGCAAAQFHPAALDWRQHMRKKKDSCYSKSAAEKTQQRGD